MSELFFSLGGGLLPLPRAPCTALGRVAYFFVVPTHSKVKWSAIERPATGICNREAHISCRLWLASTDSPRDRDSSRPITSTLTRHTRRCRPFFLERLRCWDGGTSLVPAHQRSVRLRADRNSVRTSVLLNAPHACGVPHSHTTQLHTKSK